MRSARTDRLPGPLRWRTCSATSRSWSCRRLPTGATWHLDSQQHSTVTCSPERRPCRPVPSPWRWVEAPRCSTVATPATCVATLQVGVRGIEPAPPVGTVRRLELSLDDASGTGRDAASSRCSPPTRPRSISPRPTHRRRRRRVCSAPSSSSSWPSSARSLRASVGATRVITDRGWVGHERQIGTTGVVVDPRCTSRSASAAPCSTPAGWARPTTSSASTPTPTAR